MRTAPATKRITTALDSRANPPHTHRERLRRAGIVLQTLTLHLQTHRSARVATDEAKANDQVAPPRRSPRTHVYRMDALQFSEQFHWPNRFRWIASNRAVNAITGVRIVPGSPTFRFVGATLCCAIAISLYTARSDADDAAGRGAQPHQVSLLQLLASPAQYDGERVAVRGYLGRGGNPGTLYFARELAGDASNGVELLDDDVSNAIATDGALRACLSDAGTVEVSGTFGAIAHGQYAVMSLQRLRATRSGISCRWSKPG